MIDALDRTREWDYVVIGGGTAGCAVAARLGENSGSRVLILEAGPGYPAHLSVPLASMRFKEMYSWMYFTSQQPGLAWRRLSFPFGKVMGGSSSINAMMYFRGSPLVYDHWSELGCQGWAASDIYPLFDRLEHRPGVSGGPVTVSEPRHKAPFSEAFVEACLQVGIPLSPDFNGPSQKGAGFYPVMQRRGCRVSSASAYLSPKDKKPGVHIETDTFVHRVIFEKTRAAGVEFEDQAGNLKTCYAGREVVLAAGALNSPKILMLSGIGPADHLRSVGIEVILDLPGVGQNLQDHVRIPVLYRSKRSSPGDMIYWIPAAANYVLRRKGVLTSNCCESGAMVCSGYGDEMPDLQFVTHFQSALYPGCVDLQFCLVRCASRGRISLASRNPHTPPVIDPKYLTDAEDIRLAAFGLRLARAIAQAPALRKFPLSEEIMPGADLRSTIELENYCRSMAETCYHPAGTCKMGIDSMAVVDAGLRIRGLEGIRVVDASIMPLLPNGNTCAPTYMIAERGAAIISGKAGLASNRNSSIVQPGTAA